MLHVANTLHSSHMSTINFTCEINGTHNNFIREECVATQILVHCIYSVSRFEYSYTCTKLECEQNKRNFNFKANYILVCMHVLLLTLYKGKVYSLCSSQINGAETIQEWKGFKEILLINNKSYFNMHSHNNIF